MQKSVPSACVLHAWSEHSPYVSMPLCVALGYLSIKIFLYYFILAPDSKLVSTRLIVPCYFDHNCHVAGDVSPLCFPGPSTSL